MFRKITCFFLIILCLATSVFALTEPTINAKGAILAEGTSGTILFEQNADDRLYPASTTKLMTALIALEYGNPSDIVTVNASALEELPGMGSSVYLIAGEEIAFMDLMRYILIGSGNDACNAIAEHVSGNIADFVALMNNKAAALGCTNTHFTNPHGLHDDNHFTSARDLLLIAQCAMENETIAQLVAETSVTLPVTNKHAKTTLKYTTNHLLSRQSNGDYYYEEAIGIKTGTTTPAGLCLVAAAQSGDLIYYTVILGSSKGEDGTLGNFAETIRLFEYGKSNFSTQVMLQETEPICEVPLRLASDRESVILTPEHSITALLPNDFSPDDLVLEYTTEEDVVAPLTRGQALGTLKVSYNGKEYGTMNLVSSEDIERSQMLYILDRITTFFSSTAFKIIIAVVLLVILLLVGYVILVNRRRRNRRRYKGSGRHSR